VGSIVYGIYKLKPNYEDGGGWSGNG